MDVKKTLQKIREKRKVLDGREINAPQKRSIEIIEYEDGNYSIKGFAWELPLKKDEIPDAFESWLDGSLENGKPMEEIIWLEGGGINMVKADEKVHFEGIVKKDQPKFTYFEELYKRVDVLQRIIDEHAEILRQNNLQKTRVEDAPYFDEDIVFKELGEEGGWTQKNERG